MKFQVRLQMHTGRLDVQLQDGWASGRAAELPGKLEVETLRIAHLGYSSLDAFQPMMQQGVFWLSRLQVQTALYEPTGQALGAPGFIATTRLRSTPIGSISTSTTSPSFTMRVFSGRRVGVPV